MLFLQFVRFTEEAFDAAECFSDNNCHSSQECGVQSSLILDKE